MARLVRLLLCSVITMFGLALLPAAAAQVATPPPGTIELVEISGLLDPPTAAYVLDRIEAAQDGSAQAVVLQLDSPGGLEFPTQRIVQSMTASRTPVVVWIAPRGAQAASAAAFIAMAGRLTFMAEDTRLGPALPLDLGEGDSDQVDVEGAERFIEELAGNVGRDPSIVHRLFSQPEGIDASEAVTEKLVDGTASSLSDLLRAMDGRTVQLDSGDFTFETWDEDAGTPSVTIRFQEMNLWDRLLHALAGSEVAFALLLIGLFGLVFELYNPGIGLAGIIGAACLMGAFYSLSVLPTNWGGVLLVVIAVVLLLVDLHTSGFGIPTFVGIAAMLGGGALMFRGAAETLLLSPWSLIAAVAGTLLFFVSVMTAALRVRLRRPIAGDEGIVGSIGEAKTDIAPEGTVFTKGALWRARTMETGIAAGSKVEIKATEGLVLLVEPLHDHD
ncbi:MAG: hypothetical protein QOK47_1181 [Actinomycetota bacterium]|nr:hypothetical protein [Actinomycetota bacterium]